MIYEYDLTYVSLTIYNKSKSGTFTNKIQILDMIKEYRN